MKVNKKSNNDLVVFSYIKRGDVFEIKGEFYLKTSHNAYHNSVHLLTGEQFQWASGTLVRPVQGYFQET